MSRPPEPSPRAGRDRRRARVGLREPVLLAIIAVVGACTAAVASSASTPAVGRADGRPSGLFLMADSTSSEPGTSGPDTSGSGSSAPETTERGTTGDASSSSESTVPDTSAPPPPCTWCAGGEFHPIAPVRVLNTISGLNDVAPLGAKPIGTSAAPRSFTVQLLGLDGGLVNRWLPDGVVASDVLAVAVNVTVVRPGVAGVGIAHAAGATPLSVSSLVNFPAGGLVSNSMVTRVSADGRLRLEFRAATAASTHVVIDVQGWFSTSSYRGVDGVESDDERGGRLIPTPGGRAFDSGARLAAGTTTRVVVRGATTVNESTPRVLVPDSADVIGVLVNLTAVSPLADGWLAAAGDLPAGGLFATSNVNLRAGETRAVAAFVAVGADGAIRIRNSAAMRVVVDVLGYVERRLDDTRTGRVVPLATPYRVWDTRLSSFGRVPLGPSQSEEWSLAAFSSSVQVGGVSVGPQIAALGTLTNASLTRLYPTQRATGHMAAYPGGGSITPPRYSNLNVVEGMGTANALLLRYGPDGRVFVFNSAGFAHYILDITSVILGD